MKFGDKVDDKLITKGVPPIVLQVQPTGYVKLEKPEEIRAYEAMMHAIYGKSISVGGGMHACETCSAGCSDDCGQY